ncbi:MAG: hypothetical protein OXQ32_01950 [bacterium]|nr:hypothetical protein [bacterium]
MNGARQGAIQDLLRKDGSMAGQPIALDPATAAGLLITDTDPSSEDMARSAAASVAVAHPTTPSGAA